MKSKGVRLIAGAPAHWKVGDKEPDKRKGVRPFQGLPVVDADHGLILNICKRDVLGSTKADAANCAAARAIRRTLGSEARVFLTRTYVKVGKQWQRIITPESISREITAFDRGAEFVTGEYVLNPPPRTMRLDYKKKPTGPKKKIGEENIPPPCHSVSSEDEVTETETT